MIQVYTILVNMWTRKKVPVRPRLTNSGGRKCCIPTNLISLVIRRVVQFSDNIMTRREREREREGERMSAVHCTRTDCNNV